jgi:5-methylcytosine-specific restriction endonuclease McrA
MIEFTEIMRNKGLYHGNYGKDYSLFNKEFSKWTGIDFGNKILNKKDYWINFYGLDIIKHFIYGVKQGTIIKNNNGYWIDLNGIYSNKVEWQRTLNEFDNKCAYCDSEGGLVAEHINPQSKNNSTDCCYNIVPACMQCNKEKGNMIMKEWVKYKNFPKERMQKIRNHWNNYNF